MWKEARDDEYHLDAISQAGILDGGFKRFGIEFRKPLLLEIFCYANPKFRSHESMRKELWKVKFHSLDFLKRLQTTAIGRDNLFPCKGFVI